MYFLPSPAWIPGFCFIDFFIVLEKPGVLSWLDGGVYFAFLGGIGPSILEYTVWTLHSLLISLTYLIQDFTHIPTT